MIRAVYVRSAKALNTMVYFQTALQKTDTEALIDSGATENFISPTLLQHLGIKPRTLRVPVNIRTVDGTGHKDGRIREYCWLAVELASRKTLMLFLVANLGDDHLILGYPFLYTFDPDISWREGRVRDGKIKILSSRQTSKAHEILKLQRAAIRQCGRPRGDQAIYMRRTNFAQQWAKKEAAQQVPRTEGIPEEYQRHWKVFSEEESERFPPKRSEDMTIAFKPGAPQEINCKVYPLTPKERDTLWKWLQKEQKLERVVEDQSCITSPVYFIDKKDSDEKRIIMDYRKVNEHTIRDNNPLPNIQTALERLHGKRLFSKFDIRWGYNNIRIAEQDRYKAAFKTPFGTYVPNVMYFGLCNAPPFFQRIMHRDFSALLQKYPDELGNYMDDWWIATTEDEEGRKRHKEIVHAFLDRMEECSYFLKPSKCKFEQTSVDILGWIVGGGCVRIDPAKSKGLKDWPRQLKNVHEVRQILGLLGYQRPFIRGFAQIAKPLHDLTKKGVPFQWTEECKDALETLIQQVTSNPVLWHPNPDKQYELFVDASTFALGAVLAQRDENNKPHAVLYFSRALRAPERNYTIADKEFLAIIEGLKKVRHLVKDSPQKLIIYTDHDNLRYYRHPQKLNRRVARYLGMLADFNYELKHIAGTKNWADPLSRRPDHDDGKGDNENMIALPDEVFVRTLALTAFDQQIVERQKDDEAMLGAWKEQHTIQGDDNGVWKAGTALVVTRPLENRQNILERYHDSPTAGHPGIWKTTRMVREDYWWPTMKEDVKAYVQGCLKCQATKTITRRNTPPLVPIVPTHTLPFATITMDFITKLPVSGGCDSILTVTDHDCTKAVILVPCKEQMTTEEFLELYREKVFPYTGLPQKVISDRDVRFTSTLFKELCKQLAIDQNMSTAYHPQTDGQSERTNQTVETILRLYCNQEQDNWREWLPVVQYIINSRPSATTKQSPYELWMGFVPRTHQPVRPSKLPHFEKRKQELLHAREAAQEAIRHAQDLLRKETKFRQYKKGEKVWLEGRNIKTTHPTTKLREKRFGPFEVTEVISEVVYRLNLPLNWKIHDVFHAALLHPCTQTDINKTRYEEPPPDVIEGHEEWEVEQIVKTRRSGRHKVLQYLVRWKGYSSAHDSWEPADQVHAPDLVKAYFDKNPQAVRRVERDKKEEGREGARQQNPLVICRTIRTSRTNMTDIIDISPSPSSVTPEDIALRNPERPLSPTSSTSSYGLGWLFPDEELQYPQSEGGSEGPPQHERDQPFTLTEEEEVSFTISWSIRRKNSRLCSPESQKNLSIS
jgi:hypothetical protein